VTSRLEPGTRIVDNDPSTTDGEPGARTGLSDGLTPETKVEGLVHHQRVDAGDTGPMMAPYVVTRWVMIVVVSTLA
jgi:hypothetical protein